MKNKIIKIAGYIITLASIFYIIRYILKLEINLSGYNLHLIMLIFMISLFIYIITFHIFLISSYQSILKIFMGNIDYISVLIIYGKSNLAKYLPGNFAHLAGRNIIGKKRGMEHANILMSTSVEMFFLIVSVFLIVFILTLTGNISIPKEVYQLISGRKYFLLIIFSILMGIVISVYFWKKELIISFIKKLIQKNAIRNLFFVIILYLGYFLINAVMFYLIMYFISPQTNQISFMTLMLVVNGFALSWFLGFITPGSPGGLGIRETVILILLKSNFNNESVIIASVLFRLVSVIGDIVIYLIAYFVEKNKINKIQQRDYDP